MYLCWSITGEIAIRIGRIIYCSFIPSMPRVVVKCPSSRHINTFSLLVFWLFNMAGDQRHTIQIIFKKLHVPSWPFYIVFPFSYVMERLCRVWNYVYLKCNSTFKIKVVCARAQYHLSKDTLITIVLYQLTAISLLGCYWEEPCLSLEWIIINVN